MTRVIVCCDGLDPAYLDTVDTPGWDAVADEGRGGTTTAVVPTVTNVNNVSIVTASFPEEHGITGNTYYDRARGQRASMDDPSAVRCETQLQAAVTNGERAGALVAKDKLRRMIGQSCEIAVSAEDPPGWLEAAVGSAPGIYSGDASTWLLEAANHVLETRDLDWLYVSTTDVIPHKHPPDGGRARAWVQSLDEGIAALRSRADEIVVTADHGMNQKALVVDVERILTVEGYRAVVVRLIRDQHVYHHRNLGGAAYVYLPDDDGADVADILDGMEGIEAALPTAVAARKFRLPSDRIGDLLLLGTAESVFGPLDETTHGSVDVRSHGSTHERTVPYASSVDAPLAATVDAFDLLR